MIYPVHLGDLSGPAGNAHFIMGQCSASMEQCGAPSAKIDEFMADAMSGNYQDLLDVVIDRFDDLDDSVDRLRRHRENEFDR